MMAHEFDNIGEAARLWAIRAQDASFADWEGLTDWLESDPRHLPAYEVALEDDAWAGQLFAAHTPVAAATAPAHYPPRGRWFATGGAIAAALVGVVSWTVVTRDAPRREVATAPGEHRTVDLADGSRIVLNGGTRIVLDPDKPREITLAEGEALFEVRHDARHPFVVVADGTRLVDVGTVFNVVRDGGAIDVAVADGAVDYEAGAQRIRLNQGDALSRPDRDAAPAVRKTSPEGIGGWQSGQLHYDDATLDQVARDLSRNTGRSIRVVDGAARMRFTGTLVLEGPPREVLARAGPLLGVNFAKQGDTWTMTPANARRR
ncbi:FecR domain-containing protein [Sphingomonas sp. QA11]|uniref:FecR family protein n=1 Tax=Sphingomonas sp. QA11 TaxID=2950605 RepID=UPI00234B7B48|nr:FecR domain-containing protein [Sphingomonas sp. QA11]WCM29042.1 FecR domain-containing protein [Sphingomonas sp. QA11]